MGSPRRVKILSIPPDYILQILNGQRVEYLILPETEYIPKGSRVVSVRYNWEMQTLDFMVEHESFPEVPDGERPPRIIGQSIERPSVWLKQWLSRSMVKRARSSWR